MEIMVSVLDVIAQLDAGPDLATVDHRMHSTFDFDPKAETTVMEMGSGSGDANRLGQSLQSIDWTWKTTRIYIHEVCP